MNFFKKTFLSFAGMIVVLLLLIVSMAVATFMESVFGTETAHIIVYNAKWFELLMLWFSIILIYNIFRYRIINKRKWTLLVFHCAFLFILLGAFITRYFGYEGSMHIRENKTVNYTLSDQTYIQIEIDDGDQVFKKKQRVKFSPYTKNKFRRKIRTTKNDIHIRLNNLVPNAKKRIISSPQGYPIIEFSTATDTGIELYYIQQKQITRLENVLISFDAVQAVDINFQYTDNLTFTSPYTVSAFNMHTNSVDSIDKNTIIKVDQKKLYSIGDFKFVVTDFHPTGIHSLVSGNPDNHPLDALVFTVAMDKDEKQLVVSGKEGVESNFFQTKLNNYTIRLAYGSLIKKLPFSLTLNDFELERYPGSMSPSSFISRITLTDKQKNIMKNKNIFMNNVLSYRGYRFYQSSYDKDEKGTYLSVNHDRAGTLITYIGYFLMTLGMLLSLFHKNSRFSTLLKKIKNKSSITLLIFFSFIFQAIAGNHTRIDSLYVMSKGNAYNLSKVCVQGKGGRIKPLHTYTREAARKLMGKETFDGLTAEQFVFSMMTVPNEWQKQPMIKVKNPKIAKILGITGQYASFRDFFYQEVKEQESLYKLSKYVNDAYNKKPATQNHFDKDIIKTDEKFSICYLIYSKAILRIFPEVQSENNRWISPVGETTMKGVKEKFVKSIIPLYFNAVLNNNQKDAATYLKGIHDFQKKYGNNILPSNQKIGIEILYNKMNIFKRLFPIYLMVGIVFTLMLIILTINPTFKFSYIFKIFIVILALGFLLHTTGLVLRWYLSGHAPWSNGYESMIYIAWIILLAGFVFSRKSLFTLSVTAGLSGLCLLVAHLSWMNPEITHLVPVLKSYWLTIHVAVIIGGYGFLALGSLLGAICLILFIIANKKNIRHIQPTVTKLSYINETSLILGLYLLTIGTIFGGIWANESWGRYWAWDPKEVWALITILVYVFVLHMRMIPSLKSPFSFNIASFLSFSSVIMTYIGVNYFLSGLHSYAGGGTFQIPNSVYIVIVVIILFLGLSWLKYKKSGLRKPHKFSKK